MKALSRVPIFNYNTFSSTLLIPTKSLEIKFRKKYLNAEILIELESLFSWAAIHTEIQSLLITSFGNEFIQGFDPEEIKTLSSTELKKQFNDVSSLAQSLLCLPQTIVIDMKNGTRGVGLELALAADIRIAKNDSVYCLDHLSIGLTPNCGLFSFLRPFINQNVLRSLLLSGTEFKKEGLIALGGWTEFEGDSNQILMSIFGQSPIARMQAKRGLFGIHQSVHKDELEIEKKLFNAVVKSGDYTKETDFMNPSEFKKMIADSENLN